MSTIETAQHLRDTLSRISYAPSCIDLDWDWEVKPHFDVVGDSVDFKCSGWLVRTTFKRPDTNTGKSGRGHGRWEYIEKGSSPDSVIKTCWLLLELIVRHELMEMFLVDGCRVFNPHKSVEDLKDRKEEK